MGWGGLNQLVRRSRASPGVFYDAGDCRRSYGELGRRDCGVLGLLLKVFIKPSILAANRSMGHTGTKETKVGSLMGVRVSVRVMMTSDDK